jgi:ribosomal-protein-alanine N-acetyltransferase
MTSTDQADFCIIRRAIPGDERFLWEMLYESIYVPEGVERPDRSLLQEPYFAHYVVDWGQKPGDEGLIAVDNRNNQPIGAVWMRIFPAEDPGWGYVNAETPELGIALLPAYRGHGIGTALLTEFISQISGRFKAVSLSVDPGSPVMRLYQRFRFEVVGASGTSLTMRRVLR